MKYHIVIGMNKQKLQTILSKKEKICYGLNVSTQNPYVEAITHIVTVLGPSESLTLVISVGPQPDRVNVLVRGHT